MFRNYRLRNFDFKLVIYVIAVTVIGIMAIGSAEESFQIKQIRGAVVGVVGMVICILIDYHIIQKLYPLIYVVIIGLLSAVLFMGETSHNAQRWLKLGGVQFQPSEFVKILLILFYAAYIMKRKEEFNTFRVIAACVVLFAIPFFLVVKQPDLSTSIVLAALFCVIMYAGKISYKLIIAVLIIALPVAGIFIQKAMSKGSDFLEGYQMERLLGYFYPDEYPNISYQQKNSVTAIASGQLEGKGYKNNEITSVKNGKFLSEAETDLIFAVVGEEFGFRGSAVVIILLFLIVLECIDIGIRAPDICGSIIAAGVGGLIGFQTFINIGVATFLLPNTGLPLPFMSYGNSSLISLYAGIGFVLNVRLQMRRGSQNTVN
ncbi:MAG: rod shape-determining protein RodA [Lachnospiraceae bacterium]|nr:rod shape-determining protein RodA [Lachnospiraceae bacterium]